MRLTMKTKRVKRVVGAMAVGATATLVALASASADEPPVNPPNPIDRVSVTEESGGELFPLCVYVTLNSKTLGDGIVQETACIGD